ncbi:hypothetical protein ACROYT_G035377 [Oculina patagonica]
MAGVQRNQLPSVHDEDFVNAVEEDVQCSICHLPLREPVQTRCGHRFCKECLEEHFTRQEVQDQNQDVFPDKATERKIISFAIKCPRKGCEWTGELSNKEEREITQTTFDVISPVPSSVEETITPRYLEDSGLELELSPQVSYVPVKSSDFEGKDDFMDYSGIIVGESKVMPDESSPPRDAATLRASSRQRFRSDSKPSSEPSSSRVESPVPVEDTGGIVEIPRGIVQKRVALFNRGEIDALNEKIGFLGRQPKTEATELETQSLLERKDREMKILNEDVPFLEQELAEVEQERNEMQTRLAKATQERNSLENQVAELQELVRYQEEFYSFRIKELVDDAEMPISTLKAKISLLKRACKEKDELVDKLCEEIRELRHFIATSALDDMSKIRSYGYSPENFVELSAQWEQERKITKRDPESFEPSPPGQKAKRFVALFDYDPYKSPACEHPELELKLKEGNFLTVFGDMDINGCFEADVNGVRGLVPSLYMTEVEDDNDSDLALEEHLSRST